jgi:Cu-Zn family superoxide dismutase
MNSARRRSVPTLAAALLLALSASGCSRDQAPPPAAVEPPAAEPAPAPTPPPAPATNATATIAGVDENGVGGSLTVTNDGDGVRITGSVTGLAADSEHGFHLHDTGDCSNPAGGSAGSHLNPGNHPHGAPDSAAHHLGDLPNVRADATGTATVDARLAGVSVGTRDDDDIVGRAFVVHEKGDDYSTQPSGGSGTPIACGVIELPADAGMASPSTLAAPTTGG